MQSDSCCSSLELPQNEMFSLPRLPDEKALGYSSYLGMQGSWLIKHLAPFHTGKYSRWS